MAKRDLNSINIPPLKARRRELRNNPTPAEATVLETIREAIRNRTASDLPGRADFLR